MARTYPLPVTESFPLEEMQYQGSITVEPDTANGKAIVFALVKLPNGNIYRLHLHDHLGKNYGEIIHIEPERLYVAEILPPCQKPGEFKMRMNYLTLQGLPHNSRFPLRTEPCVAQEDVEVKQQSMACDGQRCAITFTLHNHLLHRTRVRYEIMASHQRRLETGDIDTDNLMSCYGMQTLEANDAITRKNYIKTAYKLNTVFFTIVFLGSEEEVSRELCLDSP